uniref:Protein kinase domain-containing protein n=1 Tax=Macrostomum lignano TaxID=282301 RepID=A0A1I8FBB2_9PLAT
TASSIRVPAGDQSCPTFQPVQQPLQPRHLPVQAAVQVQVSGTRVHAAVHDSRRLLLLLLLLRTRFQRLLTSRRRLMLSLQMAHISRSRNRSTNCAAGGFLAWVSASDLTEADTARQSEPADSNTGSCKPQPGGHLKVERHSVRIGNYELQQTLGSGSFQSGQHPADIFMVMEYVSGGELSTTSCTISSSQSPQLEDFSSRSYPGVHYCHQRRIVHRDLKPENLLLDSEQRNVKIADFGLSNIMADGELLRTSCGSVNYAAPEVITGQLYLMSGPAGDPFTLLCGSLPFNESDTGTLYRKIKQASFVMPGHVTEEAADLISSILCADPLRRATIEDIRRHPWFQTDLPAYLFRPTAPIKIYPLLTSWQWLRWPPAAACPSGRCWPRCLSDDPQSNQLAVAYQLVLDRRLADAAGLSRFLLCQGWPCNLEWRERVRNFYVAEETSGDQQRSAAVASVDAASSIAASTHPDRIIRGSGFATAASKQHPERMQAGCQCPATWRSPPLAAVPERNGIWDEVRADRVQGPIREQFRMESAQRFPSESSASFELLRSRLGARQLAKMSLQLFMVEKDSSFLLDFRLVLPGNPKGQGDVSSF